MRIRLLLVALPLVLAYAGCAAQQAEPTPPIAPQLVPPPAPEGIDALLHPPALILDHQAALALEPAQIASMQDEMRATQASLVELEWQIRAAREQLRASLAAPRIDEATAMERAAAVADLERAIELAHVRLLVRLENLLRPEQQARLDALRGR